MNNDHIKTIISHLRTMKQEVTDDAADALERLTAIPNPPNSILEEAQEIIHGDRERTYGAPDTNLRRIATLWTAYIGAKQPHALTPVVFSPEDVCWMMVQLKMARQMNAPKRDNLVDAAGYVALLDRIL